MNKEAKKYNLSLSPLWQTRAQNLMGIEVDDKILEALSQVKAGGKLFIKFLEEDKRKNDKSPHAYLEYLSPEEVAAYKARMDTSGGL